MSRKSIVRRTGALATIAAVAVAGVMLLGLVTSGSAQAATEDASGPAMIAPGAPTGFYIWHDADGSHLRTHGPAAEHDFVARLHTDGQFVDVTSVRAESHDGVVITDGGHTLLVHVHTFDGIDGVDLRVRGGTDVRFRLEVDGGLVGTDSIFLGAALRHPAHNPFVIARP